MRFLWMLILTGSFVQAQQSGKTVLSVRFDGINEIIFNTYQVDQSRGGFYFRNPTRKDTIVKKELDIDRPLHIFFSNASMDATTKKFTSRNGSLLIIPGDSIVLDQNGFHVAYARHCRGFIDGLLDVTGLYNTNRPQMKQSIAAKGLPSFVAGIKAQYNANEKKIDGYRQLQHPDPAFVTALRDLNYLINMRNITIVPPEQAASATGKRILDSCYKDLEQNLSRITAVRSPFTFTTLYYIVTYRAYRQGKPISNFWDYFAAVSKDITESEFYKVFLLNRLYLDYQGNTEKLSNLVQRIHKAGITDPRYDSLLQAKILLREDKTYVATSDLKSEKGVSINYFNFIKSHKGSYLFVDFWASWCGPCRAQMPHLNKIKPEFKDKNIRFVSISIDEDDMVDDWIAASKDEGVFASPYNFRLDHGSQSNLMKALEIKSVPRYFLYGPNGELISAQFVTPDKSGFRGELMKAISK